MEEKQNSADHRLQDRPFLVLITSHWVSMIGAALMGTGLISWLFIFPLSLRHHEENPYIGILIFIVIPAIFFLGLILVPIGVWLAKKRLKTRVEAYISDPKAARRRLLMFLGIVTIINLVVGT
ncbi:MAG: hypothetical protein C5B54_10515, partial [Acidobacteria bacterium]